MATRYTIGFDSPTWGPTGVIFLYDDGLRDRYRNVLDDRYRVGLGNSDRVGCWYCNLDRYVYSYWIWAIDGNGHVLRDFDWVRLGYGHWVRTINWYCVWHLKNIINSHYISNRKFISIQLFLLAEIIESESANIAFCYNCNFMVACDKVFEHQRTYANEQLNKSRS